MNIEDAGKQILYLSDVLEKTSRSLRIYAENILTHKPKTPMETTTRENIDELTTYLKKHTESLLNQIS